MFAQIEHLSGRRINPSNKITLCLISRGQGHSLQIPPCYVSRTCTWTEKSDWKALMSLTTVPLRQKTTSLICLVNLRNPRFRRTISSPSFTAACMLARDAHSDLGWIASFAEDVARHEETPVSFSLSPSMCKINKASSFSI